VWLGTGGGLKMKKKNAPVAKQIWYANKGGGCRGCGGLGGGKGVVGGELLFTIQTFVVEENNF